MADLAARRSWAQLRSRDLREQAEALRRLSRHSAAQLRQTLSDGTGARPARLGAPWQRAQAD